MMKNRRARSVWSLASLRENWELFKNWLVTWNRRARSVWCLARSNVRVSEICFKDGSYVTKDSNVIQYTEADQATYCPIYGGHQIWGLLIKIQLTNTCMGCVAFVPELTPINKDQRLSQMRIRKSCSALWFGTDLVTRFDPLFWSLSDQIGAASSRWYCSRIIMIPERDVSRMLIPRADIRQ